MSTDQQPDAEREAPAAAVQELFDEILRRTHLSSPSDVAHVCADQARSIGARDVAIYVADYELTTLVPLPRSADDDLAPLSMSGTIAGRSFTSTSMLRTTEGSDGVRLWVPMLDGTERIGVMGLTFDAAALTERVAMICERYAHLVAMLVVAKSAYGDFLEKARRRAPMTLASELLWDLAPPLVFATDRLTLAGMLEPCYDNGGDALDYAVDDGVLHLAVFDAMGHGLAAAGAAAFAIAAYRRSRRSGAGLFDTYAAMDEAVGTQFPESRFVTALIAEIDLESGELSAVSAGHPPPLLIRGGRHAHTLAIKPAPPLGIQMPHHDPVIARESLGPGDLLMLYTDGLTEARDDEGKLLSLDGLSEFIERELQAGLTTPETLRRLRHAIVGSSRARLRDDATALLVEWRRGSQRALLPELTD